MDKAQESGGGQPDRVLVVDDDALIRSTTAAVLRQSGYRVEECSSALEAIDSCERQLPALIFLDVVMPEMDGIEACSQIRTLPDAETLPILMLTGSDDTASIERAFAAGASDFITKPPAWGLLAHHAGYMIRSGQALRDLQENRNLMRQAQRVAGLVSWSHDFSTGSIVWHPGTDELMGLDATAAWSDVESFVEYVEPDDRASFYETIAAALLDSTAVAQFEFRLNLPKGVCEMFVRTETSVNSVGEPCGLLGVIQDVTQQKSDARTLWQARNLDDATRMPNRQLMIRVVTESMESPTVRAGAGILVGIDNHAQVVDRYGTTGRDLYMGKLAERLLSCVEVSLPPLVYDGQTYVGHIGRAGPDSFLFFNASNDPAEIRLKLAELLEEMQRPLQLFDEDVYPQVRAGIALYPNDSDEPETLVNACEQALAVARHEQLRGGYHFYSAETHQVAAGRLQLEADLHKAMGSEQLQLYYQPKVALPAGKLTGAEALLRWQHPELGWVSPVEFIPLAEGSGLIIELGEWVFRQACEQLKIWQEAGHNEFVLAVNVSPVQFQQADLVGALNRIAAEVGVAPEMLELEITESAVSKNPDEAVTLLDALHEAGYRIALDDFGTGYSSLGALKQFPVDVIKVDRSFVSGLPGDEDDVMVVRSILGLAHALRLSVVAEGIETVEQSRFLADEGCDSAQGYYFGKPMPAEQFSSLMSEHRPSLADAG